MLHLTSLPTTVVSSWCHLPHAHTPTPASAQGLKWALFAPPHALHLGPTPVFFFLLSVISCNGERTTVLKGKFKKVGANAMFQTLLPQVHHREGVSILWGERNQKHWPRSQTWASWQGEMIFPMLQGEKLSGWRGFLFKNTGMSRMQMSTKMAHTD